MRAEWKYDLCDFDDRTLRHALNEETYSHVVCRLVRDLWWRKWRGWYSSRFVARDGYHQLYIEACRSKFVFPDYLDLVGEPEPAHYADNGQLTEQRMSELLLIGVFDWQGLRIARHQAVFGFNPYRDWDMEPRYTNVEKGWYVPVARKRPDPKTLTVRDYFSPLRNYRCERLEYVISGGSKYSEVEFRDGNPYNCRPDNLNVFRTRGRPMRCVRCEQRVTKRTSRRFNFSGSSTRWCLNCLVDLGWGTVDDT